MMRSLPYVLVAAAASLLALGAAEANAQPVGRSARDSAGSTITPAGNPSALIAAEIAFARAAQDKGQWTAFDAFATDDAEMFAPRRVIAKIWLRKQSNPTQSLKWQAHQAWASCDGTAGVTFGAYQDDTASGGWFSTVWRRQKKGNYQWALDQGDALTAPLATPDWIEGKVADCPPRHHLASEGADAPPPARKPAGGKALPPPLPPLPGPIPAATPAPDTDTKDGRSDDGSLVWRTTVHADSARDYHVWLWKDGVMAEVLHRTTGTPNKTTGG